MLKITVVTPEQYDEENEEFILSEEFELELEHSLLTVSKWESKFKKLFLSANEKTEEETFEYIRIMISTADVPEKAVEALRYDYDNMIRIRDYIQDTLSASSIKETPGQPASREQISSELIYFWMTDYGIDWSAQEWHLSRLLMLIKISSAKRLEANNQANGKKGRPAQMSGDSMAARKAENLRRRAALNSSG